jgi:hypothetical protein
MESKTKSPTYPTSPFEPTHYGARLDRLDADQRRANARDAPFASVFAQCTECRNLITIYKCDDTWTDYPCPRAKCSAKIINPARAGDITSTSLTHFQCPVCLWHTLFTSKEIAAMKLAACEGCNRQVLNPFCCGADIDLDTDSK